MAFICTPHFADEAAELVPVRAAWAQSRLARQETAF